jgi:hypothetical protein
MQARAEQGSLVFSTHASTMQAAVAGAVNSTKSTASHNSDATRAAVKAIIGDVVTAVATGAAMPRDALHMQHFSNWVDWYIGGAQKKSLKIDCAGRVLVVYCFAQALSRGVAGLEQVSMVVRSQLSCQISSATEGVSYVSFVHSLSLRPGWSCASLRLCRLRAFGLLLRTSTLKGGLLALSRCRWW